MEDTKDWKLKLRYGKETTPYKHFTAIGNGLVGDLVHGYECKKGPAFMSIRTWAIDADQSADMFRIIGAEIGFDANGKIEIFETEPEQPPKDSPFGYDIGFVPYEK